MAESVDNRKLKNNRCKNLREKNFFQLFCQAIITLVLYTDGKMLTLALEGHKKQRSNVAGKLA